MALSRDKLPQIPKGLIPEFIRFCRENKVGADIKAIPVGELSPIQSHINREKVEKIKADSNGEVQPILVSNDGKILDGHHRWIAWKELNPNGKMPCIVFDCPIVELVKLGHTFDGSFTKSVSENATYKQIAKLLWLK